MVPIKYQFDIWFYLVCWQHEVNGVLFPQKLISQPQDILPPTQSEPAKY